MMVVPACPTTATRRAAIGVTGDVEGELEPAPQRVVAGDAGSGARLVRPA